MTLAGIAYETYRTENQGRCPMTGKILPEWMALPPRIKKSWKAVSDAVKEAARQ